MKTVRIIPRLDIKGPNLVKGIHLEGLRVLGKPQYFAEYYYLNGADELFFQDTVASLYERNSLGEIISETAQNTFIPLTVGGGIRSLEDINKVLHAGADKVSINTAAIKNPNFIQDAALRFGSSTIVVAIEAIKQSDGRYLAYMDNGREHTGLEVVNWAKRVESLGAGEVVITSVDNEGTGSGFDLNLTKMISDAVNIPVVAHGGAGSPEDVFSVLDYSDVDGVAISSIFHYGALDIINSLEGDYSTEGNISYMSSGRSFGKIKPSSIEEIKGYLEKKKLRVRPI